MVDMQVIVPLLLLIAIVLLIPGFHIIRKNECGVLILNGQPVRMLPFIARIHRIDLNSPTWESELKELRGPNFLPPRPGVVKRMHKEQLEMLAKR